MSLQRPVFLVTYTTFTLFHLGGALCRNVQTLLICRLLAGIFGSSRTLGLRLLPRPVLSHFVCQHSQILVVL